MFTAAFMNKKPFHVVSDHSSLHFVRSVCQTDKGSIYALFYTSAKIIQLNEWGRRDGMHYAKNCGNKENPLAILSRILASTNPLPEYVGRGYE